MPAFAAARRYVLLSVSLLCVPTARAQGLLQNPGFDSAITPWQVSLYPPTPSAASASASWVATDASGAMSSGGVRLHAKAVFDADHASAWIRQCAAVTPGSLTALSARVLIIRQVAAAGATVDIGFYPNSDCSGPLLASTSAEALPFHTSPTDSGGRWLLTETMALTPGEARAVQVGIGVQAARTRFYGDAEIEAVADEAVLTAPPATPTKWLLPSAAWLHGANGSHWTTAFTIANAGSEDAAVTLKWLGHEQDGRGGREFAYVVPAGNTVAPGTADWEALFPEEWGAVLVSSSSPSVVVQSETASWFGAGTVGQALPAFGPGDFAGAAAKTLAPIRENGSYRTNLVLANPTDTTILAVARLYSAEGTLIGSREVSLPPLGMAQISRVAAALGSSHLELGRISVSTPTPGGLLAAYASVIDNVSNDPRTVLPR